VTVEEEEKGLGKVDFNRLLCEFSSLRRAPDDGRVAIDAWDMRDEGRESLPSCSCAVNSSEVLDVEKDDDVGRLLSIFNFCSCCCSIVSVKDEDVARDKGRIGS
jgi:hypothetical protein